MSADPSLQLRLRSYKYCEFLLTPRLPLNYESTTLLSFLLINTTTSIARNPATMLHHLYPRKDGYADRDLYPYNPSETAAYAFVAMFTIAGFTHLALMFPHRAWFPIPMIIGTASAFLSVLLSSTNADSHEQWKQAPTTFDPNHTTISDKSYPSSFQHYSSWAPHPCSQLQSICPSNAS